MVEDYGFEQGSVWHMDIATLMNIRKIMDAINGAYLNGKWNEMYKLLIVLDSEVVPLLTSMGKKKELLKEEIIKAREDATKVFNEYHDMFPPGIRAPIPVDYTEFSDKLCKFNNAIRIALSEAGILMERPDDPMGTFARRNK